MDNTEKQMYADKKIILLTKKLVDRLHIHKDTEVVKIGMELVSLYREKQVLYKECGYE